MSYKILYISPHLSTGGCPQYLLKKIELLKGSNDIYCVEYHDHGELFNIQKSQIRSILGNKYFVLGEDKNKLLSIISDINPQIIHIEEMPEYFMDNEIADKIYSNSRKYFIIETSHDSSFNSTSKRHFPDRFVFVSEFQKKNVELLHIDSHVVEYPILLNDRTNRDESLVKLGLDPKKFHVLNVGLFSPRKNQSEIIEYAKKLTDKPVQFHFIGNTAGNFQFYWEPLLKTLPLNCKLWGERLDVGTFFACMDLFLFTSRGNAGDKETSPIVIREAISYNIPTLIYNLPVYLNMYSKYKNISYLSEDFNVNLTKLKSLIPLNETKETKPSYSYVVSSYPNTDVIEKTTINCLGGLSDSYKILTTHYTVSDKLKSSADLVVFDPSNPLIKHTFYSSYYYTTSSFRMDLNLKYADNDLYHGLAVWTNYQNGIRMSLKLGYKYSVCLNYDIVLNPTDLKKVSEIIQELESSEKVGFFMYSKEQEGDTLKTVFFVVNNAFFVDNFDLVQTEQEYSESILKHKSQSNGLENYVYSVLKDKLLSLIVTNEKENELFPNSDLNSFSQVEYFTVVPVKNEDKFAVWKNSSNKIDNKSIVLSVYEDGKSIGEIGYLQSTDSFVYGIFDRKPGSNYIASCLVYNNKGESLQNSTIRFESKKDIVSAGLLDILNYNIPPNIKSSNRFNLHHLCKSKETVDSIVQMISPSVLYRNYAEDVSEIGVLKSLLYYPLDHHIILKNVGLSSNVNCFINALKRSLDFMYDNDLLLVSFIPNTETQNDLWYKSKNMMSTDCYIVNNNHLSKIKTTIDKFKTNYSHTLFNSYLSEIDKGFVSNSPIKML